ncbi:MAG TPA: zinc ribbon domain-containing protein [Pyrinomonadaceae bacterium]|jgi:putative FmdB family regulatory protein|nr:zinc ribbon domain-containing protein [Pyrinomonadaceae bacterium]
MPIYEYQCRKCNAHVEVLQKITDKPLVKCRKCGGRLEKQWSSTSFQLKGTGWYVTDYAAKKAETKEEGKKADTEGKKADTKDTKEEKGAKSESASNNDKATPKETSPSKKRSTSKTAPSSGD